MTTLERLKILFKERHYELGTYEWDNAIEDAWPKLLAVVEAAQSIEENPCTSEQIHALWNALAALDENSVQ